MSFSAGALRSLDDVLAGYNCSGIYLQPEVKICHLGSTHKPIAQFLAKKIFAQCQEKKSYDLGETCLEDLQEDHPTFCVILVESADCNDISPTNLFQDRNTKLGSNFHYSVIVMGQHSGSQFVSKFCTIMNLKGAKAFTSPTFIGEFEPKERKIGKLSQWKTTVERKLSTLCSYCPGYFYISPEGAAFDFSLPVLRDHIGAEGCVKQSVMYRPYGNNSGTFLRPTESDDANVIIDCLHIPALSWNQKDDETLKRIRQMSIGHGCPKLIDTFTNIDRRELYLITYNSQEALEFFVPSPPRPLTPISHLVEMCQHSEMYETIMYLLEQTSGDNGFNPDLVPADLGGVYEPLPAFGHVNSSRTCAWSVDQFFSPQGLHDTGGWP